MSGLEKIEAAEERRGMGRLEEARTAVKDYILKHSRNPDPLAVAEAFDLELSGIPDMIQRVRQLTFEPHSYSKSVR